MFVLGEHLVPTWGTPCMVCGMQEPWATNAQGEQSEVPLVLSVLSTVAPLQHLKTMRYTAALLLERRQDAPGTRRAVQVCKCTSKLLGAEYPS